MRNFKKALLFLVCAVMSVCALLAGCGKKSTQAEYSIYVTNTGGYGLADVFVSASSSGEVIAVGNTDSNGKFAFTAEKGVYDISVSGLPLGFALADSNKYQTSATEFTLTIVATSAVIKDTAPSDKVYRQGDIIYDFTITDQSDRNNEVKYTLSEVLQTKKMVLLNFWNTHCAPCMGEMPELEVAYRQYKEKVEVFGINVPLLGTDRIADVRNLRSQEYYDTDGNKYSLTFPLAIDDNNMPFHFAMTAIPVSVVVNRFGVIALIHEGSMDRNGFRALFEKYSSDDYVDVPPTDDPDNPSVDTPVREKPNVSQPASSEIEAAINGANFNGSYYPETQTEDAEFSWPWLVGETNGEKYIHPANHGVNYSFATIYTKVTITEEDLRSSSGNVVLVFDLQWACEDRCDYFFVIINDLLVYEYTGTEQWGKWQECYALVADEPGEYALALMYMKDEQKSEGADTVRIKNMRLISIPEIALPSLDMPRNAAKGWDGTAYKNYITPVLGDDGFYHKDSKDGPYIVADLMNSTLFNNRLNTDWSVASFAVNGYFDYNTVDEDDPKYNPLLNDTDAIALWAQAANNSELYGLTLVNDELIGLLNKFIKTQVNSFNDSMWLEFCKYFDHYGTDPSDKGICSTERNPIRGLLNVTAIETVKAHEGAFDDLKNIPDEYKNGVLFERLIVPRGYKYLFVPEKSGVYRFRSQSKELCDTMAWLYTYDDKLLVDTDSQLENPDEDYNLVLTYYLEAGKKYIFTTCFSDLGVTGEYTFTAEYLGTSYYSWQFAARDYFTSSDDEMSDVVNILNVQPVLYEGKYYNAKKDAEGNFVKDSFGRYVANTNDPIYVDFLTGARFFEAGSLELCFAYGDYNKVLDTLSGILSVLWKKSKPNGGWDKDTPLATIKGAEIVDEDWDEIVDRVFAVYGDAVDIEDAFVLGLLKTCEKIGDVTNVIKKIYLDFFDFTLLRFDDGYGIPEERYIDYTALVRLYYEKAKAFEGTAERGYADKGCVQLTEELKDALDMFAKRVGGFPELDTDWLRLCAHFEYIGPYEG